MHFTVHEDITGSNPVGVAKFYPGERHMEGEVVWNYTILQVRILSPWPISGNAATLTGRSMNDVYVDFIHGPIDVGSTPTFPTSIRLFTASYKASWFNSNISRQNWEVGTMGPTNNSLFFFG